MATKKEITERLKLITKQISGKAEKDDEETVKSYHIKGSGPGFFLSYIDRTYIKVERQTEAFIVVKNFDELGRCLVYTYSHELIIIDEEELQYIGYN